MKAIDIHAHISTREGTLSMMKYQKGLMEYYLKMEVNEDQVLAVAKSDVITKVDLDGPSLGQFDPVSGGVHFNESEISISDVPGLGITEVRGLEMLG